MTEPENNAELREPRFSSFAKIGQIHYNTAAMNLPRRPRRLRSTPQLRALVRETALSADDFILPLFVSEKVKGRAPVASMPGVFQLDENELLVEAGAAHAAGVRAVLLFGIPATKDEHASGACAEDGVVQRAVRRLKRELPQLIVMTDVCLCEYMSHGHCGVTEFHEGVAHVHNDESVQIIVATAVSHARAGADVVAPSDMMDGRIGAIRRALDLSGFTSTGILSYAAKFASSLYGPFRDAVGSAQSAGTSSLDKRGYQADPANRRAILRDALLDEAEGADILMVKPAGPYLDILRDLRESTHLPLAAYQVSGEYAQIHAAAQKGWTDLRKTRDESLLSIRRSGADIIFTYFAKDI